MARHWTCPFCNRDQIVVAGQSYQLIQTLQIKSSKYKLPTFVVEAISCANPDCGDTEVYFGFGDDTSSDAGNRITDMVDSVVIRPRSRALPKKAYLPAAVYEDYAEACLIRSLSPKAAATLVRRCLQGMIRDFCNIRKNTLDLEIRALNALIAEGSAPPGVSQESVDAIDHVRGVGNIGAHMEKDIDLIIGVDPTEVDALVGLAEMLFEEWYGNRDRREITLGRVRQIAIAKKDAASGVKA